MNQIKIHGLGGQGVVTAAKIFAEAVAIDENKHAQAIPAYGHERRGAPVYSDIIINDQQIKVKSFVYEPNYVVIFDTDIINKGVDIMEGTNEKTIFIVNADSIDLDAPYFNHQVFYVNALDIALETIDRDIPNTAMMGAMAGAGLADIKSVEDAIKRNFGKAGDINAKAASRAYQEIKKH